MFHVTLYWTVFRSNLLNRMGSSFRQVRIKDKLLSYLFAFILFPKDITTTGGSATLGSDFTPISQIQFQQGMNEACGSIQIAGDTFPESTEMFTIRINSGQDDIVVDPNGATTTVSIMDDDSKRI